MKKKLALLLAAAMIVTSIDSTVMMVNAADFAPEEVQENVPDTETVSEFSVDESAGNEDGGAFSDDSSVDESVEITEEPEENVEEDAEESPELDIQEKAEDASAEDVFSAENDIAVQADDTKEVTSIEAENVLTDGIAGMGFSTYADLRITYNDGSTTSYNFRYNVESVINIPDADNSLGTLTVVLTDTTGKTYPYLPGGTTLEAGKYTMTFVYTPKDADKEMVSSIPYDVTIVDSVESSPLYQGKLIFGQDKTIEIPIRSCDFYSFTAPEDGSYNLEKSSYYGSFGGYRKNADGKYVYSGSKWSDMKKGETAYLYCYGGSEHAFDRGPVTITIGRKLKVASMEYQADTDTVIEGTFNLGQYDRMPGKVILRDSNGDTEEIEPRWDGRFSQTTSGYSVLSTTYVVNEDGSETEYAWRAHGMSLQAGTYKIKFTLYDNDSKTGTTGETTFTVKALDYDSLSKLNSGANPIEPGGTTYIYYRFEPWKDGYYSLDWKFADGSDQEGFDRKWYKVENGKTSEIYRHDIEHASRTKGELYVVGVMSTKENTVTLNITRKAAAVGMEDMEYSPDPMKFTAGFDDVTFNKIKGTVVFDDDTTKNVSRGYSDYHDDYYLSYDLVDLEENDVYTSRPPVGNYLYKISYDRDEVASIPVTVVAPKSNADLKNGETSSTENNGSRMIFSYTPEESGKYELDFNVKAENIKLVAENEAGTYEEIRNWYGGNENLESIYVSLDAGTTYYFGISAKDRYQEIQVTPKLLAEPEKIETKLSEDREYIEGIDNFGDVKRETTVTFSDGTTKKISDSESFDGYEIGYEGCIAGEENYSRLYDDSRLTPGVWEIRSYLAEGNTRVSEDINGVTIKVNSLKEKMAELPSLQKDTETVIKATNQVLYTFTADEEGTYSLSCGEGLQSTIYIYYRRAYWRAYGSGTEIALAKDESCVIRLQAYNDSTITISKKHDVSTEDFELTDGMSSKKITIAKEGDTVSATFIPSEDGEYRMSVDNISNKDAEVPIYLYCEEKEMANAHNMLISTLEKEKEYTYKFKFIDAEYGSPLKGSFEASFRKIELKTVKNIEVVLKDSYKASDCTILERLNAFYNVKVTYQDGTSAIYEDAYGRDEYGNSWRINDAEDGTTSYDSEAIKHVISFTYWGNGEEYGKDTDGQELYIPALASFDELTVNKEVTPLKDGSEKKYYRFTAPEAGTYRFDSKMSGNVSQDIEVCTVEGTYYKNYYDEGTWYIQKNTIDPIFSTDEKTGYYLNKDQTYVVKVTGSDDTDAGASTLQIRKVKTLKSIETVQNPDQKSVLPGKTYISLEGMKIKATYTAGDPEEIVYGKADSQGMTFDLASAKWINDKICRAIVEMGGYKVSVDFEAASWEEIPAITPEQEESGVKATVDDMAFRRFIPAETGYYTFSAENGEVNVWDSRTNETVTADKAYLEKDVPYWIYIHVTNPKETATVKVLAGVCQWETIETEDATCTKDGKVVEKCKTHGDTKTTVDPATGHEWDAWTTVREADCADGEQQRVCSVCKTVEKRTIKATKAHSFSAWKATKKATVLAEGKQERTCSVCGKKETASIKKLPATIALNVKGTIPLKVKQSFTVKVTTGAGDRVKSWKSSNSKVVSVRNGKIKGLKAGKTATITVQLASGKKARFKVKVQKAAVATKSIKVTNTATGKNQGKSATLKRGQSLKLAAVLSPVTSAQKVTWSTSNKKIVTVSKKGVIKAKKKGKATITVKSGNKKYNIKITVK